MPMKKVCPRCGATFDCMHNDILSCHCATVRLWGIQRSGFFNGRGKWAKGFENQRV